MKSVATWERVPGRPSAWLRPLTVLISGTAAAQGLALAAAPALTRLYDPTAFGVFTAYGAGLAIVAVVATGCYELVVPMVEDESEAAQASQLALLVLCLVSGAALVAIALGAETWLAATPLAPLAPCLWVLPAGMLLAGALQLASAWAMRRQAYTDMARARLGQGIAQVAVQLGAGFAGLGAIGLIVGDLIGRAVGGALLTTTVPSLPKPEPRPGLWPTAKKHVRFPLLMGPGALLNVVGLQLPTLLLAAWHGPVVLGLYALGQRVIAAPLSLMGDAVGTVYLGEAAAAVREDPSRLPGLFRDTTVRLAAIGIVPIALLGLLAPTAFPPAFGPAWSEAGVYLQLLAPMLLAQFITNPLGGTLGLLARQDLYLVRETLRLGLTATALGVAWAIGADGRSVIALLSLAGVVTYAIYGALGALAVYQAARALPKGAEHE